MRRHGKQLMGNSEPEKTKWTENLTDAFADICVEIIHSIRRTSGSPLPRIDWVVVAMKFQSQTGTTYDDQALKNKWDQLLKEWALWERMTHGETRLGWNSENRRVEMSDEWWDLKIQENIEFKKFKENGYRYRDLLLPVFKESLATGEPCIAPATGRNPVQIPTAKPPAETDWFGDGDFYRPIPVSQHSLGIDPEPEKSTATSPAKRVKTTCNSVEEVTPTSRKATTTLITGDFCSLFMPTTSAKRASASKKQKSGEGSTPTESLSRIARVMGIHDARSATRGEVVAAAASAVPTTHAPGDSAMEIINQMWDDEKLTMWQYVSAMLMLENPHFREVLINIRPEARRDLIIMSVGDD